MRKVDVYYGDVFAGQLVELSKGSYVFTYDDAFLADDSTPPVSVNLPKSQKVYRSDHIFPVFTNMLHEHNYDACDKYMCSCHEMHSLVF